MERAALDEALALADSSEDAALRAKVRVSLGLHLIQVSDCEVARDRIEEALDLAREAGDRKIDAKATGNLGIVFSSQGRYEQARAQHERYLALARELGARNLLGDMLVALGILELKQGDEESATAHLEEAWTLAREVAGPGTILAAAVHRARLPGGDAKAALAALEEYEDRVPYETRMEARFRLWELTRYKTHLTEAKRLLDFAVEHSPEDCRTSMLENVPLHRDIMKAWEAHGEKE